MSDVKVVYNLAKDGESLRKQVLAAIESANTMKKRVQVAAVSILHHAYNHGDYSMAEVLVNGLGNGVNGRGLVEFFTSFGGLIVDEENGGFCGWSGKDHIKEHFTRAKETMWWELKPVNPWQGYSLEDELQKVLVRHNNMMKKLNNLDEDNPDRQKFNMEVSDTTLENVVRICNFEAIVEDAENDTDDELIEAVA